MAVEVNRIKRQYTEEKTKKKVTLRMITMLVITKALLRRCTSSGLIGLRFQLLSYNELVMRPLDSTHIVLKSGSVFKTIAFGSFPI